MNQIKEPLLCTERSVQYFLRTIYDINNNDGEGEKHERKII